MLLYDARWAPSPRRVRLFLAEKDVDYGIERRPIDLRADEQRGAAYRAINPRGTVPALVLDDAGGSDGDRGGGGGTVLTESAAICRYLDALHPEPALFGDTPLAIALTEEWTRRIEAEGYAAAVYAFRNTRDAFADRGVPGAGGAVPQIPELAERATILWAGFVATLDTRLASREWIATDRYGFADITALVTIDFARAAGLAVPGGCSALAAWHERASARPSASA